MLHREDRTIAHGDAAVRAVEKRDMRFDHALRQGLAVDGEAVQTPSDVAARIRGKWCDDEILLRVNRGGETLELKLTLGARP